MKCSLFAILVLAVVVTTFIDSSEALPLYDEGKDEIIQENPLEKSGTELLARSLFGTDSESFSGLDFNFPVIDFNFPIKFPIEFPVIVKPVGTVEFPGQEAGTGTLIPIFCLWHNCMVEVPILNRSL
ncbi:Hypp9249 [Branchiostoma lanceolatum]|uniref:Hypp9249 protein n=1 Tax=Branchiostoma lanceolatum TaxID=7740 RepID=A0A8K0EI57_BRALA|nr:Hypp9249 [Branchiostoma lanceolatum]